jgi:hypothetical protein
MARYLISFDEGAMIFPEEELPALSDAAHAVVRTSWTWRRKASDSSRSSGDRAALVSLPALQDHAWRPVTHRSSRATTIYR